MVKTTFSMKLNPISPAVNVILLPRFRSEEKRLAMTTMATTVMITILIPGARDQDDNNHIHGDDDCDGIDD